MLKVHNSFSDSVEEFIPITDNKVNMYVCGPTVYDQPHLGHARCYITWDMVYRYLKFLGYDVKYCRNITDVDDKILAKAKNENTTQEEIAKKYYDIFSDSMKKINVLTPDIEPLATKNIGEMISIVKNLIDNGFAYESDGDVYFRVKKFSDYGKLSKQPIDDLVAGARVEASTKKEDVLDFALWKKDEIDGYKSPWGLGRPGWHIECSAMARKHLATQIDIHAGGADLIFPHHENEIAQSECANGVKFVKYWLHNGFVTINKEKMSKSLKNFVSIDDLLASYDSNTIRFFILTNHYRMPVEFNDLALSSAQSGFRRLKTAVNEVIDFVGSENIISEIEMDEINQFKEAMDNDFNTSKALAVLFELATCANKAKDANDKELAIKCVSALVKLVEVLGFTIEKDELSEDALNQRLQSIIDKLDFLSAEDKSLSGFALMNKIIEIRNTARAEKNWAIADNIRNSLDSINIILKDNKNSTNWLEKQ